MSFRDYTKDDMTTIQRITKIHNTAVYHLTYSSLIFLYLYSNILYHSIKAPVCQWVSESVCLDVP